MKKIFLSILLFLIFPMISSATSYDITNFIVNSNILENGDLEVNELLVLDGNFNGYERDILYENSNLSGDDFANNTLYNASDITNIEVKAKYVNAVSYATFNEPDFSSFTKVYNASNGEDSKYVLSNLTGGYRIRMYYPANNQKVAFYIHYIVKNAVVLHEDVAELYWTFVPSGFEDKIKNIAIKVNLPNKDNSNLFRAWAHGNLSGNISLEDGYIEASIDEVIPGESVDIRTTFNKEILTDTTNIKRSNEVALDKIIEVETTRADVANALRAELLRKYNIVKYTTIIFYILLIGLGIYVYLRYGKSPKSGYYSKYNREFIDDYNVEVIDYLMKLKITPNAMSASILNLIYKKNIKAEEIPDNKKKKNYRFTLLNSDNTNNSEQILIEFLFDKVGKNSLNVSGQKEFTTLDLKAYASGTKTCDTFLSSYTKWKNSVLEQGQKENFYEPSFKAIMFGIIMMIFAILLFAYSCGVGADFLPTYFVPLLGVIFLIYTCLLHKKTEKGSLHYDKWKAFKNFLNDFGAFDIKELPEIVLWERYLVYATIFGLADKVQKAMNVHIKEIDVTSNYPVYYYFDLSPTINSSINSALSSAYSRQAANYNNSHSSSSSGGGFGGGFSSGGGFGGGGGGGRGF